MKGDIMKKIIFAICISILLAGASACYAADTVKFLVVGPMTGDSAGQGFQMKTGTQIAVDEINASGGIGGKKVEFEVADDVGTPNQATIIAQKYSLDKDLLFVLGHNNSSCSIAALPIWQKAGLPVISPSNTSASITRLGYGNYFRVITNDDIMSKQLCEFAIKKLGMKKPALIWENSDYGKGMRDVSAAAIPELGVEVVAEDSFISGVDRDYSAIITKYKGLGVDGVLFLGDYTGGGLFAKQAKNLGLNVQLAGSSSCSHPKLIEIGGDATENFYVVAPFDPFDTRPRQAKFIDNFLNAAKERPGEWGADAYDIVYLVKLAYERGGTDRESLIKALHEIELFEGVTGNFKFDEFGDVDKDSLMLVVKDQKFTRYEE
ncbi:MAG: ABC transporter substrate-binding protein [Synergistaceae bacterium]|jgi:branched-chain amino acid transport system substrate-binding protein|nr:ABC transporter substrate-binding protein [Synergistaceae bacterium]